MSSTLDVGQARVEEILQHHGVLGMKWGVHRERSREGAATKKAQSEAKRREQRPAAPIHVRDTIGNTRLQKTKVAAVGGEDHPASEHALEAHAIRQKLKKSGINALSNQEMQTLVLRGNLEQQVTSLEGKRPRSLGRRFVETHFNTAKKNFERDPIGTVSKVQDFAAKARTAA